jgi:type I restriction enzyme S subunit
MMFTPTGWTVAKVGDLVTLNPKNDCDDAAIVGFVPMPLLGISYRSPVAFEEKLWREVKKGYTHFENGDVLLGKITPCFENGKAGIPRSLPNGIGAGSTEYFVCRCKAELLDPRYLLAWFKTDSFVRNGAVEMTGSVGHKRVPKDYVIESEIPLPPLREQERIADKLDTVLARVDACRERLVGVPAILRRFKQSVLAAATSGKLTVAWRDKHHIAVDSWELNSIGQLCDAVFDGPFGSNLKSADYTSTGIRVVRLENIGHLEFDASKETYISDAKFEGLSKHTIQPGDILFSSFVDEEVRVCQFPDGLSPAINKADCFCLRVDGERFDPRFLSLRLACRTTYVELKEQVHGATRPRINLKQLKQFAVKVPSLEEQREIVRQVDALFAYCDRFDARLAVTRNSVERLTPALLAKAFRGELVPQDPNDEPASELLKRLAKEQSATGTSTKKSRGRKATRAVEDEEESSVAE